MPNIEVSCWVYSVYIVWDQISLNKKWWLLTDVALFDNSKWFSSMWTSTSAAAKSLTTRRRELLHRWTRDIPKSRSLRLLTCYDATPKTYSSNLCATILSTMPESAFSKWTDRCVSVNPSLISLKSACMTLSHSPDSKLWQLPCSVKLAITSQPFTAKTTSSEQPNSSTWARKRQ